MPVESDVVLTENECKEGVALFDAVIRPWEVLRKMSPNCLRETFGILLDQLLWSISMVKLPWMEKVLLVEWH
jgi:hypothetical protein